MSSVYVGTTPVKISTEISFDPKTGYQTHETYAGTNASLLILKAAYENLGLNTQLSERAGKSYLEIILPVSDVTSDYFELETEYSEDSIWNNEAIHILANRVLQQGVYAGITKTEDILNIWRRECEGALKGRTLDGQGFEVDSENRAEGYLDSTSAAFQGMQPTEQAIYRLLVRDGSAYETTRQVLTRVRTIATSYSGQTLAQARPIIYTTSQLVSIFGIPPVIAARLPADPTDRKPQHTIWAWKQRHNTSRYEWSGRVQEVMSWTFSTWSTLTHFVHPGEVVAVAPDTGG